MLRTDLLLALAARRDNDVAIRVAFAISVVALLWRRPEPAPADQTRPRYGWVTRVDGSRTPVVYHPGEYVALDAGTEQRVVLGVGDTLHVDELGSGQSVTFSRPTS